MEWLTVNDMLPDEITKLSYTFIPPGFRGDVRSIRLMQTSLGALIDVLGGQSATAQGLSKIITTSEKLRNSPTHILYLLKDAKANGGKGEVIGMLKVGTKHLFLFNENDKVCEVEPLCVLDFFVVHDRQRHGYGKVLFDHMLKDLGLAVHELAVDGPSPKMEQFLQKNYGIERLLKQNNNFAVAPQFFTATAESGTKSGRSTPVVAPVLGRFAAPKPPSAIGMVIHGGGSFREHESRNGGASNPATPEVETAKEEAPKAPEGEPQQAPEEVKTEEAPQPESKPEADEAKNFERPSTLSVEPITEASVPIVSPAGSTISRRDSQLTERGFFDVKFYHNKLW